MENFEPNNYQEQVLASLRSNFSFSTKQVKALELLTRIPAKGAAFKQLDQWMTNGDIEKIRSFDTAYSDGRESAIIFYAVHFNNVIVLASVVNVSNSEVEPQVISYKSLLKEVAE